MADWSTSPHTRPFVALPVEQVFPPQTRSLPTASATPLSQKPSPPAHPYKTSRTRPDTPTLAPPAATTAPARATTTTPPSNSSAIFAETSASSRRQEQPEDASAERRGLASYLVTRTSLTRSDLSPRTGLLGRPMQPQTHTYMIPPNQEVGDAEG